MGDIGTCQLSQNSIDTQVSSSAATFKVPRAWVLLGEYQPRDAYWRYAWQFDENTLYGNPQAAENWQAQIRALADDREALRLNPRLDEEIACDEMVRPIELLNAAGRYAEAVRYGAVARLRIRARFDISQPYFQTAAAELDLYYAQALTYTGEKDAALPLLRQIAADLKAGYRLDANLGEYPNVRRSRILGRAHNNIGYILEQQDKLSQAKLEYWRGLGYFRRPQLSEEWANTHDNLGRLYIKLGDSERAWDHLDQSWKVRERLGRPHRMALSLRSRALAYLRFGHPRQAEKLAWEALRLFRDTGSLRGVGLACITLASALRQVCLEQARMSLQERMFRLCDAERLLKHAVAIFGQEVLEPARLAEAYSELESVHYDQAAARRNEGAASFVGSQVRAGGGELTMAETPAWAVGMPTL